MDTQDIRELFDYNYWANKRLLAAARPLTLEQLNAPSDHSFGSLKGTLLHTLSGEWLWRTLLEGGDFMQPFDASGLTDIDSIERRWQGEETQMRAYLDRLTDADLKAIVRYEVENGVIRERVRWHCLFHLVNHGMQHRSEAAHLLTRYGCSPDDIDFTAFLNQWAASGGD